MSIPSFPKIFAVGSKQTQRLFMGDVEITEKIDGSAIAFGVINGELHMRSKSSPLYLDNPEKMFKPAIDVIKDRFDRGLLCNNFVYYGEYLKTERHNIIRYGRIPNNHIMLYAILNTETDYFFQYPYIEKHAHLLELEPVPLIYQGKVNTIEDLKSNISRMSVLGKEKIEGFVVKNYEEELMIGGQIIPLLMGKYVSEDFKEVHKREWKAEKTGKGKFDVYKSQFKSNARWCKAVHYLRDAGQLTYSPKDIGSLLKRIQQDIVEEEKENIKDWLFNEFSKDILREAVNGFPQWYKEYLLNSVELDLVVNDD